MKTARNNATRPSQPKMRTRALAVSFLLCMPFTRAEITLNGYMTVSPERSLFVVSVDKTKTSGWLAIGQNFEGFVLEAFDSKSEFLTVEKDGKQQVLRLADGSIQNTSDGLVPSGPPPIVISFGDRESISLGDSPAMLDMLKAKLALVAATVPQPIVTLRAPKDTKADRIRVVADLLRASGITRFNFSTQ